MIPQVLIATAIAGVAAAGAWTYQGNRYERLLAEQRTEYATAQVRALEIAHADTIRLRDQAQAAAAAAATRIQRLSADRDRLRAAADGLRNDRATAALRLPGATCQAARDYATAANNVFGECAIAIERLAGQADGHASDARTLSDSWPIPQSFQPQK